MSVYGIMANLMKYGRAASTEQIVKQTVEARWYLMNDGFIVVNLVPLRDEPSGSVSAKNGNRVQIWIDDRSIQNEHRNRR